MTKTFRTAILSLVLATIATTGCQLSFVDGDHAPASNAHAEVEPEAKK